MNAAFRWATRTRSPAPVWLIRLMVGAVFASEGIQKFLYPDLRGTGRFEGLGIPAPEYFGPFVGATEIVFGAMILAGLLTRVATLPLLVVMGVAIWTTKVPTFLQHGFWQTTHEGRNDWAMLVGLVFLLVAGAGRWSLDARLSRRTGR